MQPIHGMEAENHIDRSNKKGNFPVLPLGQIMNPTNYLFAVIHCIVITIDDQNNPAP